MTAAEQGRQELDFSSIRAAADIKDLDSSSVGSRCIQQGALDVRFPASLAQEHVDTLMADGGDEGTSSSPLRPLIVLLHGADGRKNVAVTEAIASCSSSKSFLISGINRGASKRTSFKNVTDVLGTEPVIAVGFGSMLNSHTAIAGRVNPNGCTRAVVLEMKPVPTGGEGVGPGPANKRMRRAPAQAPGKGSAQGAGTVGPMAAPVQAAAVVGTAGSAQGAAAPPAVGGAGPMAAPVQTAAAAGRAQGVGPMALPPVQAAGGALASDAQKAGIANWMRIMDSSINIIRIANDNGGMSADDARRISQRLAAAANSVLVCAAGCANI